MARIKLIHHINVPISNRERTREWYSPRRSRQSGGAERGQEASAHPGSARPSHHRCRVAAASERSAHSRSSASSGRFRPWASKTGGANRQSAAGIVIPSTVGNVQFKGLQITSAVVPPLPRPRRMASRSTAVRACISWLPPACRAGVAGFDVGIELNDVTWYDVAAGSVMEDNGVGLRVIHQAWGRSSGTRFGAMASVSKRAASSTPTRITTTSSAMAWASCGALPPHRTPTPDSW